MALPEGEEPTAPEWTLGDRLAKSRRKAGLSQEDMAREFDVSTATISMWETNKRRPGRKNRGVLAVTARWAEMTDVPIEWLRGTAQVDSLTLVPIPDGQTVLAFDPPPVLKGVECSRASSANLPK